MLFFPNAKINIGLNIVNKRPDGFHNLETVFCPIGLCDVLEFIEAPELPQGSCLLTITGARVDGKTEDNLIVKAYRLINEDFHLPAIQIHLHKMIPMGAGLGGGSSDASFMIKNLNAYFNLNLSESVMCEYASKLGSDCAFFVLNRPVFAYERGNIFREISFVPGNLNICVVHPGIHVSTATAYAGVVPQNPVYSVEEWITRPVSEWKSRITNDFEKTVFKMHPQLEQIKMEMYQLGAVYASMSGSGSAIYGLFDGPVPETGAFDLYFSWQGKSGV